MTVPEEQVIVSIAPDGTVTAQTKGIVGAKCLDYIALLEDMIEGATTTSAFTADYHRTATSTTNEATNDLPQH